QVVAAVIVDFDIGDVVGDAGDLGGAHARHALVVDAVVVDVARAVFLLEAADAVLETGGSGDGPGPRQVLVAQVRPELGVAIGIGVVRLCRELDGDVGQVVDVGQLPRLGAVGDVAVGEQQHRRAVLQ